MAYLHIYMAKAKWEKSSLRSNLTHMVSDEIASYEDDLGLRRLIKTNHNMK